MRTALFLAAKDPAVERTGDMAMFNLVLMLAQEMVAVRLLALGAKPRRNETSTVLEKPEISPVKLLTRSLLSGRSVVHERFGLGSLQHAIAEAEADMFVADHSYMAESFLASGRTEPLYVNTVVSESLVWKASHGLIGKLQAPRILRDEHRVATTGNIVYPHAPHTLRCGERADRSCGDVATSGFPRCAVGGEQLPQEPLA